MKSMKRLAFVAMVLAGCGDMGMGEDTPDAGGGGVTASFASLYGDYLSNCKSCHAPGAPGRDEVNIEKTLDFSTKATAYSTLKMMASGMTGNQTGCNGVPFLDTTPAKSLLLASLDETTRKAFDLGAAHANCDMDAISDQTVKVGKDPSAAFMSALKTWLQNGSPND